MTVKMWTLLLVSASFALYIGIAIGSVLTAAPWFFKSAT